MASHLASKVALYLKAVSLKSQDTFSKNDPFVVVYLKEKPAARDAEGTWEEYKRTSTINETNNPEWADAVNIDYHFEEVQDLRFDVYDRDSKSENLKKHDFIGSFTTSMSKIMGARGRTVSGLLVNKKGKEVKKGKFIVSGEEVADVKDLVEWQFRAEKLARKNMGGFGKSDPFYVISRQQGDGSFLKVFESEVIKSTTKPVWKPHRQMVTRLCNGNYELPLKLEVFDWESNGKHKYIGETLMSVNQMRDSRNLTLINERSKKKKAAGTMIFERFSVLERRSFLEYLAGGLEIKLSVAIDFTASNKPPDHEDSLHHRPPEFHFSGKMDASKGLNQYQKVLVSVGQILQDYDDDKMIPAYGFGAQGPSKMGMNMHCFPLTLDKNKVEVEGLHGLMDAYAHALSNVSLSGPTHFGSILETVCSRVKDASQENQVYEVLLIITDGMINDMNDTIDRLIEASHKPLSVVIVGVGDADFSGMDELDGDGGLLTVGAVSALRDIVQFVPFSKFARMNYTSLAEETLKEIPGQVEQFFRLKKIQPNPEKKPDPHHFEEVQVVEAVEAP